MQRFFFITALLLFLLSFMAALPAASRAADEQLEYKLKAAFLLNFAKFTRWPEADSETSKFRLCLVGSNPLGGAANGLSGKLVGDRPIEVTVLESISGVGACDMVYLSRSDEGKTAELLTAAGGQSRLTVSDRQDFAAQGGIIELRVFNDRLGFIINNTRAKQDGLSLSASLLDLAQEVL